MPPASAPFFAADTDDLRFYRLAARAQDLELSRCSASHACDRAHFNRALIALFESREGASRHFEEVVAIAPKGELAVTSRAWLQLLRDTPAPDPQDVLAVTTQRLVRDMLEREMTAREREMAARHRVEELTAELKKTQDLSEQLAALKRIQQEIKERSRPIKAPRKMLGGPAPEPAPTDAR